MQIITTHLNADFDCIASMMAAKKIYPEALLVLPGSSEAGKVPTRVQTCQRYPDG